MADANVSRIGQANETGDPKSLFLKVFGGEVLTAFAETNVFLAKTFVRTITSGKSAQFPATWKGTAGYHVPGTELTGSKIAHNERVINIDDLLVADRFIASIDEAMNHYDVRSIYSGDVGRALAHAMDANIARVGYLAARTASNITGAPGGTKIVASTAKTDADALVSAIFDGVTQLERNNVPREDRVLFVSPEQYFMLVNSGNRAINRDLNPEGNGSVASGLIYRIAGLPIVMTNDLPTTDQSADATVATQYQGDFSTSVALILHKSAVGTVKLLELSVESEYDIRRQGTLIVGKYAVGHGVLRPECAVEIATA